MGIPFEHACGEVARLSEETEEYADDESEPEWVMMVDQFTLSVNDVISAGDLKVVAEDSESDGDET